MRKHLQMVVGLILCSLTSNYATAQECVKIESILVAACLSVSNTEGSNEMMRFKIGPTDLNTSGMDIIWGSGQYTYAGLVQNANTANIVNQMNATIEACGFLKQPTNGVLPANSKVLIICGLNVSVTANPFTNLSDTLYVIFQNSSQIGGHFLNYATAGTLQQTTTISFFNIANCSSSASYFRNLLITTAGVEGNEPGATVNFDENMNATYVNNGCTAPVTSFSANWTTPQVLCNNNPINLNDYITGTQGGTWTGQGVIGSIFDPTGLSGSISITYTVSPNLNCNQLQPISLTQNIIIAANASAAWNAPAELCASATLNLVGLVTGTPGGVFSGSGVTLNNLNPSGLNGPITVTYTVGLPPCQIQNSQIINILSLVPPTITGQLDYCNSTISSPLTATASSGANIVWFDASNNQVGTGETFTPPVGVNASYSAIQQSGACASAAASVFVTFNIVLAPIGINNYTYCSGSIPPILSVISMADSIFWFSDALLTNQISFGNIFNAPVGSGSYWVIAEAQNCADAPLQIDVIEEQVITAQIITGVLSLCQIDTVVLQSVNTDLNEWSTGELGQSLEVTSPGIYILTRTNSCNTATDEVEVTGLSVNANFTVSAETGFVPLTVVITDNSSGGGVCNWTINNGFVDIQNLVFTLPGEYNLVHSCSNNEGCADSDSILIIVKNDSLQLLVPNVFTPNGDGYNDLFKVQSENVKTFNGLIFNRWGNKIYEWSDVAQGWGGDSSPDGTYFYIIFGTDVKDQGFERKGYVHIIRKN